MHDVLNRFTSAAPLQKHIWAPLFDISVYYMLCIEGLKRFLDWLGLVRFVPMIFFFFFFFFFCFWLRIHGEGDELDFRLISYSSVWSSTIAQEMDSWRFLYKGLVFIYSLGYMGLRMYIVIIRLTSQKLFDI